MNKIIAGILVVITLVVVYLVLVDRPTMGTEVSQEELTTYFEERLTTLGQIEGITGTGEGLDANLLMASFPGFQIEDFDGVEATEGRYELDTGEIYFVRDFESPVSPNQFIISTVGYDTLLQNISDRLGITLRTQEDVDEIIETINLADIVVVGIDEEASVLDTTITPLTVVEDSRCAEGVVCVQMGTVRVNTSVVDDTGERTEIFQLAEGPITPEGIHLVRVDPQATTTGAISSGEYIFYFSVER
ncbi:MAG: hypothetical protein WDZ64_00870 [Parcubacteria group bacterium]